MKECVAETTNNGRVKGSGKIILYLEDFPNSSAIIQCHVLEGYRPVTEEEKMAYEKPLCAKCWENRKFYDVADTGEWAGVPYFVPIDFKFESKNRVLTDEDAKKRPAVIAWDYHEKNADFGILLAVINGYDKAYVIKDNLGCVDVYRHCELIGD